MLSDDVYKLTPQKLLKLKEALSAAAIALELGGRPREVFRRSAHKASPGVERRLYRALERASAKGLARLSAVVEREFGGLS